MNSLPLSESRPSRGKGRSLADVVDGAAHPLLALAQDTAAGHPTCGNVHGAEGIEIEAFGAFATVGHQVYLQEARPALIPFGERCG